MNSTGTKLGKVAPECDRCRREMVPTGWMPRPDGMGGIRRWTLHRCQACGRLHDELYGYRNQLGLP